MYDYVPVYAWPEFDLASDLWETRSDLSVIHLNVMS